MNRLKLLTAGSALLFITTAHAGPINPANVLVYRVGDGSAALDTPAVPVFLEEYSPTGALVQTIPLPSSGVSALTATGNVALEGVLTLSQDRSLITFTGYRKNAGGSNPNTDAPATTNRVIGTIDVTGTYDLTTTLTDAGGVFRSAATVDGTQLWAVGATGVRYVTSPYGAGTTTVINTRNSRQATMVNNVLYTTNGVGSIAQRVQTWGTLPTAAVSNANAGAAVTLLTTDIVQGMAFVDLDSNIAGDDTMYICSTVEDLIRKYTYDGTNWNASGSISSAAENIFARVGPSGVNLFFTNTWLAGSVTGNALYAFTDTSGFGGTLTGTVGSAIATASDNTAFRGVAGFVPEPTAAVLVIGGLLLGAGRGRYRR